MSAQLLVAGEVVPFDEEMNVEFAEDRRETVDIVEFMLNAAARCAKSIAERLPSIGDCGHEEAIAMNPNTLGDNLPRHSICRCGGNRLDKGAYQYGFFMEPTVFIDVDPKMRIAQEEIFGPVVSIIPCDGLEDAIEIANGVEYGLSSSLYTKDVNQAFTAMRDLYAGITYINAPTIGAEVHLPFGGTKATGNGHREGGIGAIDFYSEWKSVYIDYSDKLQKAQIDRPE